MLSLIFKAKNTVKHDMINKYEPLRQHYVSLSMPTPLDIDPLWLCDRIAADPKTVKSLSNSDATMI